MIVAGNLDVEVKADTTIGTCSLTGSLGGVLIKLNKADGTCVWAKDTPTGRGAVTDGTSVWTFGTEPRDVGGQVARGSARNADLRHLEVSPPVVGVQLGEAAGRVGHRLEADCVNDVARGRVAALLVGGEVVRAERLVRQRMVRPSEGSQSEPGVRLALRTAGQHARASLLTRQDTNCTPGTQSVLQVYYRIHCSWLLLSRERKVANFPS